MWQKSELIHMNRAEKTRTACLCRKISAHFSFTWRVGFLAVRTSFFSRGFRVTQSSIDSPNEEKSYPQNSNGSWQGWNDHLICRNGFILSFCVSQLNGAADKCCQCVFVHLAALLTHWVFQEAFIREETPHGSNSLCKQNLKQNYPPVNNRQPQTHSHTHTQTHAYSQHKHVSFALHLPRRFTRKALS